MRRRRRFCRPIPRRDTSLCHSRYSRRPPERFSVGTPARFSSQSSNRAMKRVRKMSVEKRSACGEWHVDRSLPRGPRTHRSHEPGSRRSARRETNTDLRMRDRLARAASVECDHGPTAGHGFHGQDAEILSARKQERAAAAQMIGKHLERLMAEKLDRRTGNRPQLACLLPLPITRRRRPVSLQARTARSARL